MDYKDKEELQGQIDDLEANNQNLESEVADLKKIINGLKDDYYSLLKRVQTLEG